MAILGTLLRKGITLRKSLEQQFTSPQDLQKHELRNLLILSRNTQFGSTYKFNDLLRKFKSTREDEYYEAYKRAVPIFDYETLNRDWWARAKNERDVCWPEQIKYFALSSGTSSASSKSIPVSTNMMKSIRKASIRQLLTISRYDLPNSVYTKGILALGGSTDLRRNGHFFEGDLSGITTSQIPFWFQHFYKPGKKISKTQWSTKLDEITKSAQNWDIGIIAGVPAWLHIMMENIIKFYGLSNIHEIWPNLSVFIHGGVPFEPYKKSFEKLLGKPLMYMETYLASEGFIAFQADKDNPSMRLILNNGIFYEFVPFNGSNFTEDGDLRNDVETLKIDQVEVGQAYAILMSTNSGAWRYLIGDVIKFISVQHSEIIISGRTKLFLSLCGEHLSLDNLNKAIELSAEELNVDIREFTVLGETCEGYFSHRWFIGSDDEIDEERLRSTLDRHLAILNDDYAVERKHALKQVFLHKVPTASIYHWMESQGKLGASNKFPRVLKREKANQWMDYVRTHNLIPTGQLAY